MRVYLLKMGEALPGETSRPRRMSRLAHALVDAGHEVSYFTTNWNHQLKSTRDPSLTTHASSAGYRLVMIKAPGYRSNVSLARLQHHRVFAHAVAGMLETGPVPDLVFASFPTVPVARALARWRARSTTRLVFDVRDLVPDVFFGLAPGSMQPVWKPALAPVSRAVGRAFSAADGITAVSPDYLAWAERLALTAGPLPRHRAVFELGHDLTDDGTGHRAARTGPSPLTVIFAGTFGRSFDLETVIGAAEIAQKRGLPIQFQLVGTGEGETRAKEAAAHLTTLLQRDWVDARELSMLYANADIGLMAYAKGASQGLPNKVFDYMAHGLAIVNGLSGEAAAFVETRGLGSNYQAQNPESLVAALLPFATDRNRVAQIGARARTQFMEEFRSEDITARMIQFIERVAAS